MSITLKLKPEIEAQLIAQAAQRGVSIEQLLETAIGMFVDANRSEQPIAPQEKAARFSQWARNHAVTAPLSDTAVSRESIYTREDEML
jgi:hypothetical protein